MIGAVSKYIEREKTPANEMPFSLISHTKFSYHSRGIPLTFRKSVTKKT